jgi:transposase-like protein
MTMKQRYFTLRAFQQKFKTDDDCRQHLFFIRFPDGFRCPECGHDKYYPIPKRSLFQCIACRHQTSLTAGTILHKTRTPLRTWFWALFLVAHDKRGISALALARELDVSYKTGWLLLHKIRHAMRSRDEKYVLSGIVEMDETYFGGPGEEPRRGRGTNKTPALVAMSLSPDGKPRYLKMQAVTDVKSETLLEFVNRVMTQDATIVNDGFRAYQAIAAERSTLTMKFDPINNPDHMKWLHRAISNAKAFILGTYHGIKGKHLQAYLDEYCYRYNRRNFQGEWFNRLLHASVSTKTLTFAELTE